MCKQAPLTRGQIEGGVSWRHSTKASGASSSPQCYDSRSGWMRPRGQGWNPVCQVGDQVDHKGRSTTPQKSSPSHPNCANCDRTCQQRGRGEGVGVFGWGSNKARPKNLNSARKRRLRVTTIYKVVCRVFGAHLCQRQTISDISVHWMLKSSAITAAGFCKRLLSPQCDALCIIFELNRTTLNS